MTIENAMIIAIEKFKSVTSGSIRSISLWETSGSNNDYDYILFGGVCGQVIEGNEFLCDFEIRVTATGAEICFIDR